MDLYSLLLVLCILNMAPITIITDSRGMYLEDYFPERLLKFVDIRFYSGITLNELIQNLPRWAFLRQTRKVYIMIGINDCTLLDKPSRTVRVVTPFISGLYSRVKNSIRDVETVFKREFPAVRITICPLYGLDIGRFNKSDHEYRYQGALNEAILLINQHISRVNERNRVRTPFLCNVIHRYRPKRRSYIALYDRLIDGLHPGDYALERIADYLIRCIDEDL